MELVTLDSFDRPIEVVESFESFIWTERYSSHGEILIEAASTPQNKKLLPVGTFLGLSESERVMRIETLRDEVDEEGNKKLILSGKETSSIMNDRIAETQAVRLNTEKMSWRYTGTPQEIIMELFRYALRNGTKPKDQIPMSVGAGPHIPGNLPMDTSVYTIERPTGQLYDAIKELADIWDLGFRLFKTNDGSRYFEVYVGNNLTSSQTSKPPVIFSADLDSLQAMTELYSVATSKNVAIVTNEWASVEVIGAGIPEDTGAFARRVIYIDGTDIIFPERPLNHLSATQTEIINTARSSKYGNAYVKDAFDRLLRNQHFRPDDIILIDGWLTENSGTGKTLTATEAISARAAMNASSALGGPELIAMRAEMAQKARLELFLNRAIRAFDGVIVQSSPYKYNRDYGMGDLVEVNNSQGLANQMMVTEQIFVSDANGERAYPTLSLKKFVVSN